MELAGLMVSNVSSEQDPPTGSRESPIFFEIWLDDDCSAKLASESTYFVCGVGSDLCPGF
jgi:hypothetical protein